MSYAREMWMGLASARQTAGKIRYRRDRELEGSSAPLEWDQNGGETRARSASPLRTVRELPLSRRFRACYSSSAATFRARGEDVINAQAANVGEEREHARSGRRSRSRGRLWQLGGGQPLQASTGMVG